MIHLRQAVVVEGKYDKIRLSTKADRRILSYLPSSSKANTIKYACPLWWTARFW